MIHFIKATKKNRNREAESENDIAWNVSKCIIAVSVMIVVLGQVLVLVK